MPKKIICSLIFAISFLLLSINIIGAQTNLTDLGISVSVKDQNIQNGDIICSNTNGYVLCNSEYEPSIYGVVNNNPSAAVQIQSLTNSQTVVSKGELVVRVSSTNGNIKTGDYLTTSKIPGVAELSTKTGYVIGTALADYNSDDKNVVGQIAVSLNIHANNDTAGTAANSRQNLIELLRNGLSGLGVDPISALRYILAAIMVIVSFVIGFIYFGRIAKSAIEAIGRNPLAIGRIEISLVLNILIMLAVVAAGLVIAYLILAL